MEALKFQECLLYFNHVSSLFWILNNTLFFFRNNALPQAIKKGEELIKFYHT